MTRLAGCISAPSPPSSSLLSSFNFHPRVTHAPRSMRGRKEGCRVSALLLSPSKPREEEEEDIRHARSRLGDQSAHAMPLFFFFFVFLSQFTLFIPESVGVEKQKRGCLGTTPADARTLVDLSLGRSERRVPVEPMLSPSVNL